MLSQLLPNIDKKEKLSDKRCDPENVFINIDIFLESGKPNHPTGTMYLLMILSYSDIIFGTKVKVVAVGPVDCED